MAIKKGNDATFTIPDGQEVKSIRVICKKHGDISDAVVMLNYSIKDKETGKNIQYKCGYCIPCLNEYLMKLEKAGELAGIGFVPVFGPKTDEEVDEAPESATTEEATKETSEE